MFSTVFRTCVLNAIRHPSPILVAPLSTSSANLKGHSKWQNIKATKGKNDMLKSQALNQLLKKVNAAVRKGGFDIKLNNELAGLEKDFRAQGLPLDTFKNYLQKLKDKPEKEFRYEVIGPGGSFFIIEAEAQTRSIVEGNIKKYFNKVGGFRFAGDSSAVLSWFDEKGVVRADVVLKDGTTMVFEKAEEAGIELDCEQVDLVNGDDNKPKFEMICDPRKVYSVENELSKQGFVIEHSEVEFRPKHPISLTETDSKLVEKLYGFLQEDESISQIYDNVQPSE